jgi:hypothetical protein
VGQTSWKEQSGLYSPERLSVHRKARTGQPRQNSQDGIVGKGYLEQDSLDRAARTGLPGQVSLDTLAWTDRWEHVSRNRSARQVRLDRSARTVQQVKVGRVKTA